MLEIYLFICALPAFQDWPRPLSRYCWNAANGYAPTSVHRLWLGILPRRRHKNGNTTLNGINCYGSSYTSWIPLTCHLFLLYLCRLAAFFSITSRRYNSCKGDIWNRFKLLQLYINNRTDRDQFMTYLVRDSCQVNGANNNPEKTIDW